MRRLLTSALSLAFGVVLAVSFLCTAARCAEPTEAAGLAKPTEVHELFHPFWTGPATGIFTDAGPDSAAGPRAKIHVPLGIQITDPIVVKGWNVIPEVEFQWTTKAYLGEDSEPLQDATYNWFPKVRVQPQVKRKSGFQWATAGPEHNSNGEDNQPHPDSRSMNQFSVDSAWKYQFAGVLVNVYAKAWFVYDYGENTETIGDAVNLFKDVGGKITVVGSVAPLDLAVELGPEWQKVMTYLPLHSFYHFGIYGEYHHGKMEGLLNYDTDVTTIGGGVALRPNI